MKLTIELVPRTSWFSNLRSLLSKEEWDVIRKGCYAKAGHVCEICSGVGPKHPVECHEVWEYDEDKGIQKLVSLIALCPSCHEVKHIGLAGINGRREQAVEHFCKVNECTIEIAESHIEQAFSEWHRRSGMDWTLDVSKLEELKND